MTEVAPWGHLQSEPRAVYRATNHTSSPELDSFLRGIWEDLRASGRRIGMSGLRRLYWRWLESAQADWDFGRHVLTYADPTGERATANALRGNIEREFMG